MVVKILPDERTAVNGGAAADGEGGSLNTGSNPDPDAQTPTLVIQDPNVDIISNPTNSTNSVDTVGMKIMTGIFLLYLGLSFNFCCSVVYV